MTPPPKHLRMTEAELQKSVELYIPKLHDWINANEMRKWHWSKRHRLTKAWRGDAAVLARHQKLPNLQRAHISFEVHKTTRRKYDPGNLYPTAKAIVDGFVDYGLLPDDDSEHLDGPDIRQGDKRDRPGLTVKITRLNPRNQADRGV